MANETWLNQSIIREIWGDTPSYTGIAQIILCGAQQNRTLFAGVVLDSWQSPDFQNQWERWQGRIIFIPARRDMLKHGSPLADARVDQILTTALGEDAFWQQPKSSRDLK